MTIPFAAKFYAVDGGIAWREPGESHYRLPDNARPLVVIDPEDREQVDRLRDSLRAHFSDVTGIQCALREFADPTPPKPDEPTGLGAVVEDDCGKRWVRVKDGFAWRWRDDQFGEQIAWDHLVKRAVRVLSEGVS